MKKTHRILAMTAAAVVAAQAGFAQTTTTPTAPTVPSQAPINLDFLGTLFRGDTPPTEESVRSAFSTAGLTVDRYRTGWDGEIRVRATTADGQEVRVRVEEGEVRYSLRSGGDSTDDNGAADTSDDNGPSSDSNGSDTSDNTRDGNGNGGGSGGGNGGKS
ncbi:hypothetical protein C0V75_19935 [Tabrizicola sp. TH137]|uniref:hypothetical protein n=1 Tax=Tabrizicola sp. TH137 TaxID=2067452 RepID=UPI000C7B7DB7|nr:hypothetical protein [Tabrizicola sp. TH137]PLL10600.1 hypothetical protein C0V75_19935 [Tabrizicola sp. TH137]